MTVAFAYQAVGMRFEHLDHVDRAAQIRGEVYRHRPHAAPGKRRRVESGALQVILKRHPRCRHIARRRHPEAGEVTETEARLAPAADQQEGVACHHLREAHQRAARVGVVMHHHAHRPAP